jgi:NADP-dependent 3-hydroxy acid dehydrogenase YdfG
MTKATACQFGLQSTNETRPLAAQTAMVTGASSGIGRAIAVALAGQGANLCVVGRNAQRLADTVDAVRQFSSVDSVRIDLTEDNDLQSVLKHFDHLDGIDILVHSAGIFHQDQMAQASVADFDRQYAINVRAPYVLTQLLLPQLIAKHGQIVFINSTAGRLANRPNIGQYAATKHALKAIADNLREEVNQEGVRVLTVYLGRTATPMQQAIFKDEGRAYHPEALIQPIDVACVVVNALCLPRTIEVTDISIRPAVNSANWPVR